jgi:hypothetical protein
VNVPERRGRGSARLRDEVLGPHRHLGPIIYTCNFRLDIARHGQAHKIPPVQCATERPSLEAHFSLCAGRPAASTPMFPIDAGDGSHNINWASRPAFTAQSRTVTAFLFLFYRRFDRTNILRFLDFNTVKRHWLIHCDYLVPPPVLIVPS